MIFTLNDVYGGSVEKAPEIKRKVFKWATCGGTKKDPIIEEQEMELAYVEFDTLEQVLDFMKLNNVIVQIRMPLLDQQGYGFPHYRILTDTPSGQFRQR